MNVYLTGDMTLSLVAKKLQTIVVESDFDAIILEPRFDTWFQDFVFGDLALRSDYVFIVLSPRTLSKLYTVGDVEAALDIVLGKLSTWEHNNEVLITNLCPDPLSPMWLIEGPHVWEKCERMNRKLYEYSQRLPWLHIVDMKAFLLYYGTKNIYCPRYEVAAQMYLYPGFTESFAEYLFQYIKALAVPQKKLLIVDLDNTLWGGISGEEGISGIKLGPSGQGYAFMRFQEALLTLKRNGVLLAIVSKNDEDLALDIIRTHPNMLLKPEDFVTYRINWKEKSQNVLSIADELNLGIASFVFFDDSKFERDMLGKLLPDVAVLDVPEDPAYYVQTISNYTGFDTLRITIEDRYKTEMYHAEAKRKNLKAASISREEFLNSLGMKATIAEVDQSSLDRAHQLIMKTNQFNLTTKRYTRQQLQKFVAAPDYLVFSISLQDNLGESGTVGVLIVEKFRSWWRTDNFLLSCRVLGRTLEFAVLHWLTRRAAGEGVEYLIADFLPTRNNTVAKDFLVAANFDDVDGTWRKGSNSFNDIPQYFVTIV